MHWWFLVCEATRKGLAREVRSVSRRRKSNRNREGTLWINPSLALSEAGRAKKGSPVTWGLRFHGLRRATLIGAGQNANALGALLGFLLDYR